MRVAVLGSGSRGNAILVEGGGTRVLVDAGFSARDLARRLEGVEVDPGSLAAIVVTHDHSDHTRGMGVFARRHGTPLYLTRGTRDACAALLTGHEDVREYRAGRPFNVGALSVEPFLTVHDAREPVGVAVLDPASGGRLGVATDLGRPTAGIRHALSNCHILVLEANHDEVLLQEAPYPWSVKARIKSSHGHLSNRAAAQFARELYHADLLAVVLAHLSAESNRPEMARRTVAAALDDLGYRGVLEVAVQDEPLPFLDVGELRRRRDPGQLALL
ncbi:MAG TPA: MBL fold metallo-hydrolase [Longimicrobiales bacterium]|nr:MBL fold metallo-hydrolase [Longimicrobiales bacterium]